MFVCGLNGKCQLRIIFTLLLMVFCVSIVHGESLVSRSQYTGNNPRGTDSYEVGYSFKTGSTSRSVEGLGFIDLDNSDPDSAPDGDGLISPITVSLWEQATSQKIAAAYISPGTSSTLIDGFRYAGIAGGGVTLSPNTTYVISFDASTVSDWWLDANKSISLDPYFVGFNPSSTCEVRWGTVGSMPTTTGSWGVGRTYGTVNMLSSFTPELNAYAPYPAEQSAGVGAHESGSVKVTLSWNTGKEASDPNNVNPDIANHLLYFKSDDSDFSTVSPVTIPAGTPPDMTASYLLTGLDYDRQYFWRVDEELNSGSSNIQGSVWSFTTMPQIVTNQISIDPAARYQVFEGFGEGTMDQFAPYWYNIYPSENLESYLDQLYTLNDKGLGFSICRVLMPVGDAPGHTHHDRMWLIGNVAPKSFELEDGVFDWTGHEGILWRHQGAAQRGAIMWANWYSMPYWLTISGCTSGASDGLQNLISGKEARFTEHACDVLDYYKANWGIDFDYVSLLNECEATWWREGGGQPGCYVSSSQAITLIDSLNDALTSRGLNAKQVAYDAAYTTAWSYLDDLLMSSVEPYLEVLTCHQYSVSSSGIDAWKNRTSSYNKNLWQTEWGDWSNAGYPNDNPHLQALNHAAKMSQALNDLSVTGWVLWEPEFIFDVDQSGFHPREAYWTTAQYSRHIRPGMQRIASSDQLPLCETSVWIDDLNQQLVLVTYNASSEDIKLNYNFSPYEVVRIKEIRRTSSDLDYEYTPFVQTSGDAFSLVVPRESVTTLVADLTDCTVFKRGDYNNDCAVDLEDLSKQASQWLADLPCEQMDCDLNADCHIDLMDFVKLAEQWD